ncbi:MAG TPA: hypothetical protein PLR20_01480 [Syntrophales bacterium]|nr:hypothetical protein [Syntrophales bacterium]HOX93588.1 hypothetical protein [Syntrophales bacterium]HPI56883.1 hypothetical protein [Syntrophales bacterium]HPN23469.1 hypothetical protein [Syntrophales bacterium]HQM28006.1 hypothetical protein [Syntrophales bacterium]
MERTKRGLSLADVDSLNAQLLFVHEALMVALNKETDEENIAPIGAILETALGKLEAARKTIDG